MSLSDCPKCWDTPCSCGYEYRKWTRDARIELAAVILGVPGEALDEIEIPDEHPRKAEK